MLSVGEKRTTQVEDHGSEKSVVRFYKNIPFRFLAEINAAPTSRLCYRCETAAETCLA